MKRKQLFIQRFRLGLLLGIILFVNVFSQELLLAGPKIKTGIGNGNIIENVATLRDFNSKRASSWNRSGINKDGLTIPAGDTKILLEEQGVGCIKHFFWLYLEFNEAKILNTFQGLVLCAFWDNSNTPSIEVPLGDFFGVSNGFVKPISSLMFCTSPGSFQDVNGSWGFNCYLPMPFSNGARIEIKNEGDIDAIIWFHIDYEIYADGSVLNDNVGRLHAQWNRENPTEAVALPKGEKEIKNLSGEENYRILDIEGDGQFAGYFLTVVNSERSWWGEGDDMIFIDGESFPPSIHGTGTEEVFGGGASPVDEYTGPYTGFHCIENRADYRWWGTTGMYRFYVLDPVRFRQSILVSIEHGHGNDKSNDYSSVAFWYQRGVNKNLPSLPLLSNRLVNFK